MSSLENRGEEKYPSNAYHNITKRPLGEKEEKRPDPDPIAKGKEKKPSFRQRLTESFLSTSGEDIKDAVIFDWVIPGIKNIVESVVHMILFGDKTDPRIIRSRGESRLGGGLPYNKYYDDKKRKEEYISRPKSRQPEVVFTTRQEAEEVMTKMFDEVSKYGRVTVKDLYSMSDMPTEYAMSNWGWRNLTGTTVVEVRGGYMIKFPKVEEMR